MNNLYCPTGPIPRLPRLPAEIQNHILEHLPYPDLLSLKLTNSYFYYTVETTVYDRADWLLERAQQNLPIPRKSNCLLGSDVEFCSHPEVSQILRQRLMHLKCPASGSWCRAVPGGRHAGGWVDAVPRPSTWHWYTSGFRSPASVLCACVLNKVSSSTNIWLAGLGALIAILVLRLEVTPLSSS